MKIHLSNKRFDRKPTKDEARIITNTITREECEIDIKGFAKAVGEEGRTFTPALFYGRRIKDEFKSQQVFVLDFDDGIGPKEFFMRAEKYEIKPAVLYETFSSEKDHPKFRVVFINDVAIEDRRAAEIMNKMICLIFPEADQSCKDVARMFYGGKKILYCEEKNTIDIYNIYPPKTPLGLAKKSRIYKQLRNKGYQNVYNVCKLFRDFYEKQDIPHEHKFLLASNLCHIKGGKKLFFDGLKEHHSKWNIDWKYMMERNYQPMSCKNGGCPYADQCGDLSLYSKLKRSIQRIEKDDTYIEIGEAERLLEKHLISALDSPQKGIHLIKAQTALGKTAAYCRLLTDYQWTKPAMIVVPTIKLQEEIYTNLQKQGMQTFITPNMELMLKRIDLEDLACRLKELYDSGYGYKVKGYLNKYMLKKKDELTEIQKKSICNYLNFKLSLDGTKNVITTHAMFLALDIEILRQYEIIIDEDILMTVFKGTASIEFRELQAALKCDVVPGDIKQRIEELLELQDGSTGKTAMRKLYNSELDAIYEQNFMENGYKKFTEELRRALLDATGFEENRIYYKKDEDYPQTSGDRIFLEYVVGKGSKEVVGLHVEKLYENYCNGFTIQEIVRDTMQDLEKMKAAGMMDRAQDLHDYEKIKSHLFIRLLNAEKNQKELKHGIYRIVGDIALVLYMRMGSLDGVLASFKVRQDMVKEWKQDCWEVFENALQNTYTLTPPRIIRLEKLLMNPDYSGDPFMDAPSDFQWNDPMGKCLSTKERTNGAVAVFLPGVAEFIGGGYYLVFTSIHEVMVHPEESVKPEELQKILRETIETATLEEDILSYKIYGYSPESGKISMVELDEE